jgi:hypothetical protein
MEQRWSSDGPVMEQKRRKKELSMEGYGKESGFVLKKNAKHLHIADSFCNFAANFHTYKYII